MSTTYGKTLTYKHPQGATITVRDGVLYAVDKNGKPKKTSATVEKLARGHGGWVLVEDSDEAEAQDLAELFPGMVSAPERVDPRTVVAPMRFREGDVEQLYSYINNVDCWMQQKVDGVRAVLDFRAGHRPSFRSSSGKPLVSSAAAPAMSPILRALSAVHTGSEFSVDGEILNGVFHVFDLIPHGGETTPFMFRHAALEGWVATVRADAPSLVDHVRLLPTAKDREAKLRLVQVVSQHNGEGWMVKGDASPYDWGSRVNHSLKMKRTHTADCVVMARDTNGKENFTLGVWTDMGLVEVGQASAIGKVNAAVGSVVEVKYLYVGAGGKLVQPTVLRKRLDKLNEDCTFDQLVPVDKSVFEL